MFPIISQSLIKNLKSLQQYECKVCYEVDPTVMRCSGPCKASICLKCASSISKTTDRASCPHRCSTPLKLEPIPNFKIEFKCPFNAEKCKEKIEGNQAFLEHHKNCTHMTPQEKRSQEKKEKFLCEQGHALFFLDSQFTLQIFSELSFKTVTRECAKCKQVRVCRAYCNDCSSQQNHVAYCYECRPIPCTKSQCPMGHQFLEEQVDCDNYDCDLCGFAIFNYSGKCYHDEKCNFGVCQQCYKKLPKTSTLTPLKPNIQYFVTKKKNQQKLEEILNGLRYRRRRSKDTVETEEEEETYDALGLQNSYKHRRNQNNRYFNI